MGPFRWTLLCAVIVGCSMANIIEVPRDQLDWDLIAELNSTAPKKEIELNTAWLRLKSLLVNESVEYYWQHGECYECPLQPMSTLDPGDNYSTIIQSSFYNELAIYTHGGGEMVCGDKVLLKERGDYVMIIEGGGGDTVCQLALLNQPENYNMPVLYAFAILMGLALIYAMVKAAVTSKYCQRVCFHRQSEDLENAPTESMRNLEMESNMSISSAKTDSTRRNSEEKDEGKLITPKEVKKERLRSLDAFRGLNILLMIFVNYGGGGYWYFSHAVWNGLYITDLIFPWFIFIMGTSLGLGISSLVKKEVDPVEGLWGIIWRSVKLFAVGIMYNTKSSNDLENIRMTGVLQRLAMVYFITAIVHYAGESLQCCMRSRGTKQVSRWRHILSDLAPYFGEWITMLVIIGIYCYFTYWFAVPGCEAGYVGPGGLHRDGAHAGCTGGAALYIDLKVYTMRHIYQWPDIRTIYQTDSAFDPEGLLGTLTSIFLCFLGLQAGKILVCHKGHRERLVRWLIWAIITGGIGTLLCKAQLEDGWVPINKNIMSISFVLVSAGTGFIMLSVMYILIDSWKLWNGQPFTYAGMNSIVLYMCHSIFQGYFPVSWQMPDMTQHWQLLLLHTWGTAFWAIIAYAMYKKKVFISL